MFIPCCCCCCGTSCPPPHCYSARPHLGPRRAAAGCWWPELSLKHFSGNTFPLKGKYVFLFFLFIFLAWLASHTGRRLLFTVSVNVFISEVRKYDSLSTAARAFSFVGCVYIRFPVSLYHQQTRLSTELSCTDFYSCYCL